MAICSMPNENACEVDGQLGQPIVFAFVFSVDVRTDKLKASAYGIVVSRRLILEALQLVEGCAVYLFSA